MKEKDFQTHFNKWCKHYVQYTSAFELKVSKGKSLPFNALQEHQKNALLIAKHGVLVWKIPDAGYQNPFDSFVMRGVGAYVVIAFRDQKKVFYLIDIDDWCNEEKISKRKSITEERAEELSTYACLG